MKKKTLKKTYWRKDYGKPPQFQMPVDEYRHLVSLFKQAGFKSWRAWLEPVLTARFERLKKEAHPVTYFVTNVEQGQEINTPSVRIDPDLYNGWKAIAEKARVPIRTLIREFALEEYQLLKDHENMGILGNYKPTMRAHKIVSGIQAK